MIYQNNIIVSLTNSKLNILRLQFPSLRMSCLHCKNSSVQGCLRVAININVGGTSCKKRKKKRKSAWRYRQNRHGFDPWVGKIPWTGKWQPTPAFFPRKFHGQRSLAGYSPCGCKEMDTREAGAGVRNFWDCFKGDSQKLDSRKFTHLLVMLERRQYQPFKVNKARITVSSCLAMIFGIKNTKVPTAKLS